MKKEKSLDPNRDPELNKNLTYVLPNVERTPMQLQLEIQRCAD